MGVLCLIACVGLTSQANIGVRPPCGGRGQCRVRERGSGTASADLQRELVIQLLLIRCKLAKTSLMKVVELHEISNFDLRSII